MGVTNYGNRSEKLCGVGRLLLEVYGRLFQDCGIVDAIN